MIYKEAELKIDPEAGGESNYDFDRHPLNLNHRDTAVPI